MRFNFNQINKEKKQAYFILIAVGVITFFSFQNFEEIPKPSLDVSDMLRASDKEVQKTKNEWNEELSLEHHPESVSDRQVATENKSIQNQEPIKIKLRRAPAKSINKNRKKKTKSPAFNKKKKIKKKKKKAPTY